MALYSSRRLNAVFVMLLLPQWIRSEKKCHFCIKLKFFNFFTIQLRELKFLPMNVLMSTSIFRKLQLSSLYSLIIILFSKIKRCNFLSGQFLSVWLGGIKIMKSMLSYFAQWSELNLFRVLLAPSFFQLFCFWWWVFDETWWSCCTHEFYNFTKFHQKHIKNKKVEKKNTRWR